eukprot:TRINITY_DN11670_c0_g2_i2.p1 TRINITY_DN11670_c0_g2~~TRINITY_DN11670_c0_g2_i2.p1  ORF type:complete len:374 (-),score=59.84 TRINITY_DN11670_c0_g2_i2:175-1296(-)
MMVCSNGCDEEYDPKKPCQCNSKCRHHKNCCDDYRSKCGKNDLCAKRGCKEKYDAYENCQCSNECKKYGNCCSDYDSVCPQPPAPVPTPPPAPKYYLPKNRLLRTASSAKTFTFYMYRAQSDVSYPPENVNTATLSGTLWYLHHEIIPQDCPARKFDITKILRYKVTTKTTQTLLNKKMNFGVRYAFNSGRKDGPCNDDGDEWERYGYFVGCNVVGEYPNQQWHDLNYYPDAIWWSLPGPCPNTDFWDKSPECKAMYPGGACKSPNGAGNCTYHYEDAGFIEVDELVGIKPKWANHEAFCKAGCREDNNDCISWWDGFKDRKKNAHRVKLADDAFKKKYPHMPRDSELPSPKCDFNFHNFYPGGRNCAGQALR